MPAGCTNQKSGDTGSKTLTGGQNSFQITNTVTCAATVKVLKHWVINGTAYDGATPLTGYTASYTLDGATKAYGSTYAGYVQGQSVTIAEPDANVTVPSGCTNVKSGDLGSKTLAKGDNTYTVTNTVTCASTVEVDKTWVINGTTYADGKQPDRLLRQRHRRRDHQGLRPGRRRLQAGRRRHHRREHAHHPQRLQQREVRRDRVEDARQGRQRLHRSPTRSPARRPCGSTRPG